MWGATTRVYIKISRISIFTSQIFFALVKEDEKKLTGIM